jgi:hypothetical protein
VKREALASYSYEQLEQKLDEYGFARADGDELFFDPAPPKEAASSRGRDLYLPRLISTSGVSEPRARGSGAEEGQGVPRAASMPAGRRMGTGHAYIRGAEA